MGEDRDSRFAKLMARVRQNKRSPLMIVLPTVAALGAGAAVAVGSIPSSNGTYTGCYNTVPLNGTATGDTGNGPGFDGNDNFGAAYGQLRLIDPSDTTATIPGDTTSTPAADVYSCYANETTATWNQTGPQGVPGTNGTNGRNGLNGQSGASGQNGASGGWESDTNYGIGGGRGTGLYLKLDGVSGQTSAPITTVGSWNQTQNKKETTRHAALARAAVKGGGKKGAPGFKSATQTQRGLIKLKSFTIGSETPTTNIGSQSSGAGAGKATNIQTFSFVKSVDNTSTQLYQDLTNSKVIQNAEVIAVHNNNGKQQQVAEYKFADLIIKSISQKGNTETVSAVVKSIETKLGSGKGSLVTSGWNKVQNTADEATVVPAG